MRSISLYRLAIPCFAVLLFLVLPSASPRSEPQGDVLIAPDMILPKTKKAAEDVASKLNLIAGASSVVAASCAASGKSPCGGLAAIISGSSWLGSGVANHLAIELSDPHYMEIVKPNPPKLDFSQISTSATPMAESLVQAIGLVNAIYTTVNRTTTAINDGSTFWAQQQYAALKNYQNELYKVIKTLASEAADYLSGSIKQVSQSRVSSLWSSYDQLKAGWENGSKNGELAVLRTVASCLGPQDGFMHKKFCATVVYVMETAATQSAK